MSSKNATSTEEINSVNFDCEMNQHICKQMMESNINHAFCLIDKTAILLKYNRPFQKLMKRDDNFKADTQLAIHAIATALGK